LAGEEIVTLPDFLVIGAAKSGTVSLYHYLGQHPQIFMCPVNETNFFALDGYDLDSHFRGPGDRETMERHCVKELTNYEALFADAGPDQRVGESSPLYLYSSHAPRRIHHYLPDVRLIALLRHPTARAHANFRHYRLAGIEPLPRFERALAAEEARKAQGWGPWPFWFYRDVGYYGRQMARYCELFDEEQILVCFYEQLRDDPLSLLQTLYAFVGVDERFVPDTSVRHNVGSRPRVRTLQRLMTRPNRLKRTLRALLPDALRRQLRDVLRSWNEVRMELDPALGRRLTQGYLQDMKRLQALVGHDLSAWREPDAG
jgi:hypothetical protein